MKEVLDIVEEPGHNLVLNLLAVSVERRPEVFADLLSRLLELSARSGHPHWIAVDEAHHVIPAAHKPIDALLPPDTKGHAREGTRVL